MYYGGKLSLLSIFSVIGHSTPSHLSDKLSGYDTSTTARSSRYLIDYMLKNIQILKHRGSSSSSTDSLASWSSREARDREGEVRPAGLSLSEARPGAVGESRPATIGINSNGEEGRRIAPLGDLKTHIHDSLSLKCIFPEQGRGIGGLQAVELKKVSTPKVTSSDVGTLNAFMGDDVVYHSLLSGSHFVCLCRRARDRAVLRAQCDHNQW